MPGYTEFEDTQPDDHSEAIERLRASLADMTIVNAAMTKERDEARAFAIELQQAMLDSIACDVRLPPATTLRAGVSFATLRAAIEQRKSRDVKFVTSLETELEEAQHLISDLKELLIPARDMIRGFSFGECLASDIDVVLARPDTGKTEETGVSDYPDWGVATTTSDPTCECPICGRIHRHLGIPPWAISRDDMKLIIRAFNASAPLDHWHDHTRINEWLNVVATLISARQRAKDKAE